MDDNQNLMELSEQLKNNICKRLPVGFSLLKLTDRYKIQHMKLKGEINYNSIRKEPRVASSTLQQSLPIQLASLIPQNLIKKQSDIKHITQGIIPPRSFLQIPQGKTRQTQKIKNIIQRFRKHQKFPNLANHLNKLGFFQSFTQIEAQSKKNLHTIDTFKDRCMMIFNLTRSVTSSPVTIQLIDQMIDEFVCYVEQAKKLQFQTNLQNIQKSIDKITRQISDIKEQGNSYLRKKKKSQKNFDDKQIMYIADLVRELPKPYLVGVWEILQQKPFGDCKGNITVDFFSVKIKKLREIQYYVKKKLINLYQSRERKRQKLIAKRKQKIQNQPHTQNIKADLNDPSVKGLSEIQQKSDSYNRQKSSPKIIPGTPTFQIRNIVETNIPTFKFIQGDNQEQVKSQINSQIFFQPDSQKRDKSQFRRQNQDQDQDPSNINDILALDEDQQHRETPQLSSPNVWANEPQKQQLIPKVQKIEDNYQIYDDFFLREQEDDKQKPQQEVDISFEKKQQNPQLFQPQIGQLEQMEINQQEQDIFNDQFADQNSSDSSMITDDDDSQF